MNKIGNKELAAILTSKYGLDKLDAEKFISAMFDVLGEGLQSDKQVKVKGLGTFKVVGVASRKSVDVNTGNPIVINGRDKISFVPDATLRNDVNRPFAQFDTVPINDGVDFSVIDAKYIRVEDEPIQAQEPAQAVEPIQVHETVAVEETRPEQDVSEVSERIVSEGPEQTASEMPHAGMEEDDNSETQHSFVNDDTEQAFRHDKRKYFVVIALAVIVVACVAVAYYFHQIKLRDNRIEHLEARVSASSIGKPVVKATIAVKTKKSPKAENAQEETEVNGYEEISRKDSRIRTGAYVIVGIDHTVTVMEKQTLADISKAQLGPGMECYVEAVNGGKTEFKTGEKINIPKLRLKKSKDK